MTRTAIPRNLKKKLQASLENLTPRQAGRLFLLLYHEAQDKGFYPLDYPPLKDLEAAWERRLDQAKRTGSKNGEAYAREAKFYNGWLFLRSLVGLANMAGSSDVWPLLFKVQYTWNRLDRLLLMDSFSEVARLVDNYLAGDQTPPKPASREEFARLTTWAEEDALEALGEVAVYLVEDWLEDQTFETLSPPVDFIRDYNAAQGEEDFAAVFFENQHNRRAWAEAEGDRLLVEVFAGNRDDLEAWVKFGDYVKDTDRQAEHAKEAELEAHLVALWQAGELEARLAVSLRNAYDPVTLDAGTIPAWAALRAVWGDWLYDKGYRQREKGTPHPKTLDGVRPVFAAAGEGAVEGEDLARLAGDFLADCKKRPWGRNLAAPKSVDLAALGFFLNTVETPLTPDEAPDLGRVAWEVFTKSEDDVVVGAGEPYPVASVRSLKPVVAALGSEYPGRFWILAQYYPTDQVVDARLSLARIVRLVRSMQVSHRAFTYPPQVKEDMTFLVGDLGDFLGVSFLTPLEEAVRLLGEVFGEAATFRRTYDLLAGEYFGGLPLLHKETRGKLDQVDIVLAEAEAQLADWLKSLEVWPWGIDTTSLKLVKAEADEELARRQADDLVDGVLTSSGLKRHGFDLGPEEEPAKDKRP